MQGVSTVNLNHKYQNMRILVTGSNGQLGQSLQLASKNYPEFGFFWADRSHLDLANAQSIYDFLADNRFDLVINCAAYTQVDLAQTEEDLAKLINATNVGILATELAKTNTKLIHISTDYVFNGQSFSPIDENHKVEPVNFYGQSKLKGELLAVSNNSQSLIIRTSWVYSEFGKNFVKTILKLLREKSEIKIICDQIGSPTSSHDLARAILDIVRVMQNSEFKDFGTYHFSGEGVASWYDFAKTIQKISGLNNCNILPIFSHEYKTDAQRPFYSVLDKTKIKKTFELQIPYWQDSLAEVISRLEI